MTDNYQTLHISNEGAVYTVLINTPPANLITRQLLEELDHAFEALGRDADLRAVVLGSAGEKAFCAGADIRQFLTWNAAAGGEHCLFGTRVFRRIDLFPKPVICALSGLAYGGGLELALACDFRVVDETARLAFPECSLGIQPGYGGTQRLPRLVGPSYAKKMLFTGLPVTAQEALRVGLADEQAMDGLSALETAQKIAALIALRAPLALTQIKKSVDFALDSPLEEGLLFENEGIVLLFGSEDMQEGAAAFLEKRAPVYQNK